MLDVAIGFATVMLALSLLIMSLTQPLASLLALRGARLRQGIEELIKQTLPDVVKELEKKNLTPKQSSEKVLQHPLVSDWGIRSRPPAECFTSIVYGPLVLLCYIHGFAQEFKQN